jgi:hypothetical protein
MVAIRQSVRVEAGGVIRVQSPRLREGSVADVVVTTTDSAEPARRVDRTWAAFIGSGAHSGRTVAEIDAEIRELRDEWDR